MKQARADEGELVRYLLGEMRPEEQAQIEERYLADPELHDELRATERDLIDRYVHGELPAPEAFEKVFLSSPVRRQRVEFARALVRSSASAPAGAGRPLSRRDPGRPYRAWQAVAAAFVVLVAGWLVARGGRGLDPVERPSPAARAGERPPPPAPPRPGGESGRPAPAPPVRVATLVLTSASTRSADLTPTLVVEGESEVHLELQLDAGGPVRYRAVIRTPEGEEVWREDRLRPRRTASGESVMVEVPASHFRSQDYVVKLLASSARGFEEVGSYTFRARVTGGSRPRR